MILLFIYQIQPYCFFYFILASLPPMHTLQINEDPHQQIMDKLGDAIESLFLSNDYTLFLKICRSFIKKRPQIIHDALSNNQTDLLLKFIPVAFIGTLQYKNELGETFLLHAARLNRPDIVKALLETKESDLLLEAVDNKNNNIFHILCSNSTSTEILDLFIKHLLKNSINIQQKFDHVNQDHQTPLQLSIYKNNLLVTKLLSQHFKTNVYETYKTTGDNLIHLAVRYGDLTMVKYLIEDGQLFEEGDKSNISMKPIELALSLKRNDIYEYLNEKYPPLEINEDDSSSNDD
jgi:ankyrin repeat protein